MLTAAYHLLRCVLFVALGVALSLAGVQVLTERGAVVWGLLLALSVLDGWSAVHAYRQGRAAGVRFAVFWLMATGWRKP